MKSTNIMLLLFFFNVSNRSLIQGNKIVGVFFDRIYQLYNEEKVFVSAEDVCEERDGYLAVIRDPSELEIIANNLFDDSIETETRNVTKFYWIGLERNEKKKWSYTDGTQYRAATHLPFTSWNDTDDQDYKCAGIVTAGLKSPNLRQQHCLHKAPFICQYDTRPCVPKVVLEVPVKISQEDVYRICDSDAAQRQNEKIPNDCECPAGNVAHSFAKVYCNSKNWYKSAICISGCPPPPTPSNAILVDPKESYLLGDKIVVMCMDGKATENAVYRHQTSLRCTEGGLWYGTTGEKMCLDPPEDSKNKSAALKRYVLETGSRTDLECDIPGHKEGIKPQTWLWFKGAELLNQASDDKTYTIDEETGTLKIEQSSSSSKGSYTCFARYKGKILSGRSYYISASAVPLNNSANATFQISLMFLDVRLLMSLVLIILYKL